MKQSEFLEKNVFNDLENQNNGFDKENSHHFSQSDFNLVLERVEHYGIGIYELITWRNGTFYAVANHVETKKKATDPQWYQKAFLTFKTAQPGLTYAAKFKVSNKLLAR
ncbi:hypothetical protein MWU59_13490 [Flavobacteriaceae bacterium F08102]|nr:hypothetical protein [Flavobacteriaceae bacterium F08102]